MAISDIPRQNAR